MAPQPTYEPPHVQLGRLLLAARRRGLSFDEAWNEAVRPGKTVVMTNTPNPPAGAVRWPSDRNDRVTWQAATLDAKDGWRRAYDREPPSKQEAALALLAPGLDALGEVAEDRAGDELASRRAGIEARQAVPLAA